MKNPFDRCSREYGRYRPNYPAELYDQLISRCALDAQARVLDAGAGTGKGGAPLVERGIPTISSDPSQAMIQQGLQSYPNLRGVCAAAEQLPFANGAFDLVMSAQSFHWFDPPRTLPEFSRVLNPAGFLTAFWNTRDRNREHTAFFEELAGSFNPEYDPGYRTKDWGAVLESGGLFEVVHEQRFRFEVPMTVDDWIGLARSISYIRAIGDEKMPAFENALREGLSRYRAVDCPYVTHWWLAQKTGDRSPQN